MSVRQNHGFSLVELAVVLMIFGMLAAITVPAINRHLTGSNVRNAARILSSEMRLARQRAVTKNVRAWVYHYTGTNQYWTGEQTRNANGTWSGITWKGPIDLPKRTRQAVVNYGTGYNYFYYDVDGRPSWSGSVAVVATQGPPDTARVNLDLSGSVW